MSAHNLLVVYLHVYGKSRIANCQLQVGSEFQIPGLEHTA